MLTPKVRLWQLLSVAVLVLVGAAGCARTQSAAADVPGDRGTPTDPPTKGGADRTEGAKEVPLYDSVAPGSEKSAQKERELKDPATGQRIIVNVVKPTLTVVRPEAGKANGPAVVICPGGGFAILSIESQGLDAAKFLAGKGVTCFVLK